MLVVHVTFVFLGVGHGPNGGDLKVTFATKKDLSSDIIQTFYYTKMYWVFKTWVELRIAASYGKYFRDAICSKSLPSKHHQV